MRSGLTNTDNPNFDFRNAFFHKSIRLQNFIALDAKRLVVGHTGALLFSLCTSISSSSLPFLALVGVDIGVVLVLVGLGWLVGLGVVQCTM